MSNGDGGKGSSPRPIEVSRKEYENNWTKTFNTNKQQKEEKKND